MPVHPRSIKSDPLGVVDSRVLTMTDSSVRGFLSPSFSSVIAFEETPQRLCLADSQEDKLTQDARSLSAEECAVDADDSREATSHVDDTCEVTPHTLKAWFPNLELDVTLDRYRGLDGLAEPMNPQNTPASPSERDSIQCEPCDTENIPTSPAPQRAFALNWLGATIENSYDTHSNGWLKPSKLRFSTDEQGPLTSPMGEHKPVNVYQPKELDLSPVRCVRFSPQSPRPLRPMSRPVPSVERPQDYVASHRQKKQYEKWKGTRCHARASPYRSPTKLSASRPNKRLGIHFSSLSNFPFRRIGQARPEINDDEGGDIALGEEVLNAVDRSTPSDQCNHSSTQSDLFAFSFSLHKIQCLDQPLSRNVRVYSYVFQWGMNTTARRIEELTHTAVYSVPNDLVMQVNFILPALVLRLAIAVFSIARSLACSPLGVFALRLVGSILALLVSFAILLLSKFGVALDFHVGCDHRL
ncbi:hypothetical protein N7474_009138 [Penicillium riverlandense]|uniref:uncharacterized protein n=1 Tax=Penicillium riverlandense TaxID=1903569 RepID=UPI0025475C6E|nr:uncharacterized protein N7474_009138 [Penicillium riverlandense]KAJ5807869.1 hypothetical protein N7474_009138 [Penicillium riverlandense]